MPDYRLGKIYQIINKINNKAYVGSTTDTLENRFSYHMNHAQQVERYPGMKIYIAMRELNYDFTKFYIELIENCPCDEKEDLLKREGYWIRRLRTNEDEYGYNLQIAGRTIKEHYDDNRDTILSNKREWYQEHKEEEMIRKKNYRDNNLEHCRQLEKESRERNKESNRISRQKYHKKNKDKLNEGSREYHEEHKEEILARKKANYDRDILIIINCPCGSITNKANLRNHVRSKKHIDFINSRNSAPINNTFICRCGSKINNPINLSAHYKTKKHINYISNPSNN